MGRAKREKVRSSKMPLWYLDQLSVYFHDIVTFVFRPFFSLAPSFFFLVHYWFSLSLPPSLVVMY